MADRGTARSVSGEMMTAGRDVARETDPHRAATDVIDAEYFEVAPEPRQAQPQRGRIVETAAATPSGLAFLQRGMGGAPRMARRGGPLFWLTGGVAILAAFWVAGGHSAVRPGLLAAMATQDPDLQIGNVRSRTETVEGEVALLVDGDIRNEGEASGKVPTLAVTVLSRSGETAVYRLGTLRTPLAPGAKYNFSSRLDMPKDGVKTVSVAFDQ